MDKRNQRQDEELVRECLSGSETAWQEFYSRFINLMRSVVRKRGNLSPEDVEDVTQSAFVSLATALANFEYGQSLPRYVCLITERVMIDDYRKRKAARRAEEREIDQHDETGAEFGATMSAHHEPPDEQVQRMELESRLRGALDSLDPGCKELLTLRYFRDLSFKEISETLGGSENTVTVQTRRCLDRLRKKFDELERKGMKRWRNQSRPAAPNILMTFFCLMSKAC
jgi:RNA polymerase sigma-70 factor, ECF subfamily